MGHHLATLLWRKTFKPELRLPRNMPSDHIYKASLLECMQSHAPD